MNTSWKNLFLSYYLSVKRYRGYMKIAVGTIDRSIIDNITWNKRKDSNRPTKQSLERKKRIDILCKKKNRKGIKKKRKIENIRTRCLVKIESIFSSEALRKIKSQGICTSNEYNMKISSSHLSVKRYRGNMKIVVGKDRSIVHRQHHVEQKEVFE